VPAERSEFVSYRVRRNYRRDNGREYFGTRPSAGSLRSICREISECTQAR